MTFTCSYRTPKAFSDLVLTSDGDVLTGLWFVGSRGAAKIHSESMEKDLAVFRETHKWLDIYFSGHRPDFTPPYRLVDSTPFREAVSAAMLAIPYGETTTYGAIAAALAKNRGLARMSAQAVGGAVGWNPIGIIIPCHRVIGVGNRLTGYGGGMVNKIALLALEGHDMRHYIRPSMPS